MKTCFTFPRRVISLLLALTGVAAAQSIPNPSFEANSFTVFPGYISGNAAITGWTASNNARVGLNPAGGTPFADNGAVPNGSNVAFIQSTGIGSNTLTTTISGLTLGKTYRLQFRANCRQGYTAPGATFSINGGVRVPFTASPSVGGSAGYYFVSGIFTSLGSAVPLVIRNETFTADADSALLVDDFSVTEVNPFSIVSWSGDASSGIKPNDEWAYHFGSTVSTSINGRTVPGVATAAPAVLGKFDVTGVSQVFPNDTNTLTALTGTGSAVMARDFIWGGNPATVTLPGLTPGATYVVTFFSVGWDPTGARQVTFTSGEDSRSVNQNAFGENNGIRVDYSFLAIGNTRNITIAQQVSGVSWHLYGLALRQTSALPDLASYRFDSLNKRVTDGNGVPLNYVEGVVLNEVVETPDAVDFSFGSSLNFDASDVVTFTGPKPVRIVVNGDVTVPTGASFSADPALNEPVAGGGTGAPTTPGGSGGKPMTNHYYYFVDRSRTPDPLAHWEGLIQAAGYDYVLPRPGTGGAGGTPGAGAMAGVKGQPGIGAGAALSYLGVRGPDQDERSWDGIYPLAYGYGGAVPTLQTELPGFQKADGALGGMGWNNPAASIFEGETGEFHTFGIEFTPLYVLYTTDFGTGGTSGAGGGPSLNGSPGGNGGNGADANHNGRGNGEPGQRGAGGTYAANDPAVPVLRGGNGGGAGGAGSGAAAGAPGGAGGGGGGGGIGPTNPGGKGGKGGQGKFGGAGGTGGTGGAGGHGGGAFEISATGNIVIGGTLTARGSNGSPGGAGQPGQLSTAVMPGHPEYTVDPQGQPGVAGVNGSGNGGRGGDGGEGGRGGTGGAGAGGGGGAGGTIILRAANVSFSGDPSPSAHLDVSGGSLGGGGIGDTVVAQPGAFFISLTPSIALSQTYFSYTINRGQSVPKATFDILNDGPAGRTLHWKMDPQWWIHATARSGSLAPGATFSQTLNFDTSVLGGGIYSFSFLVRDADPNALTVPRQVTIEFTVIGAPDDHFNAIQGGTLLPATMGSTTGGVLETNGDSDAFRINITQAGTLETWTTGNTNTEGSLLNEDGSLIVSSDDHLGDINFRLVHAVTPGTYFIIVRGSTSTTTGGYTLHVNVRAGDPPFTLDLDLIDGNKYLTWDGYAGQKYRVLSSTDVLNWNLDTPDLFAGEDLQMLHPVPGGLPRQYFRLHRGDLFPVTAFSFQSSSQVPGSANLVSATPGTGLGLGVPSNLGDTALLLNGLPMGKNDGVLLATAAAHSTKTFVVQAPSSAYATPPAGFPDGHWLAASENAPNSDKSGVIANAAWFPFAAGWVGGQIGNLDYNISNYDEKDYFFMLPPFGALMNDDGETVHVETDPDKLPVQFSTNLDLEVSPMHQGAWITSSAGTNAQPHVSGIRPQFYSGKLLNILFYNYKADGTEACREPLNVVFVPWTTPNAVVGNLKADGSYTIGSANYTATLLTNPLRYHLNIPASMGPDLSKGTFLGTAYDLHPDCLITYRYPATGGIDVIPVRLPLTNGAPTPAQCGFNFVYIPHNRTIFGPGVSN